MIWRLSVALAALLLAHGAVAAGKSPVALVTVVHGNMSPPLEAFSEVAAGDAIDLGADGRVEFNHYPKCETVIVKGGRLSFSEQGYTVQRGQIVDAKKTKCAQPVDVQGTTGVGGGLIGGGVVRSAGAVLKLRDKPGFVLLGAARADYKSLRILKDNAVLAEGPVQQNRFSFPAQAAALPPGKDYVVELVPSGNAKGFRVKFEVVSSGGSADTLLRVE
ncbi:MAG: hypothetical protein FJX68_09650 [Alphaproteobacteria bacterium]|nr:hypothetical protein [Alphaproteobacteria bacterium]